MKKWLFCILLSFSFSSVILQSKAKSEDWVSIIGEVISWGAGDGLMESCAEYIGCDEYEDVSLSDQITGVVSGNKKTFVCAANSVSKNSTRIVGTFLFSFLPFPASYMVSNLTGNAIQCVQAIVQSESVKKLVDEYELCYSDPSEGHPLPLTDKQIAKILPKMNLWPTVDNIVAQYSKLCVKKKGDNDSYRFYSEGDTFEGVYIHRANGYAYLLCASLFDACPCVFNIQGGKISEPEYERDKKNDFIKIRSDGSLIHKGDDETSRENEIYYQDHYAKHCRLIRFKEIYEQSNDLASIYSDACFDLHGYSKRQANITAGIVQCFEDTARNIFEKPILSVNQDLQASHNPYDVYVNDYSFLTDKRNKIKNLLQGRTSDNFSSNDYPAFLASDVSRILQLLQELWFAEDSTSIVAFTCTDKQRAIYSGYKTSIYNKYILAPAVYSTANCCSGDSDISDTCFGDEYSDGSMIIKPSISENQTDIGITDMFAEIDKVDLLLEHIKTLQSKASDADAIKVSKTGFTLTLFDLLRNKIKVIAIMALVFWVFIIGWKMINGDYGRIKTQEFGMIALRVFLCYMVVFSDATKDFIFNMAIQTSQGVGMFFNEIMEEFRTKQDNKYSQACNMKQNSKNTPKKIYKDIIPADTYESKEYICQTWEEKICDKSDDTNCLCEEYKMSCQDSSVLNCSKYFKNYDGSENRNYCKTGTCTTSDGDTKKANIYKTGSSRKADEYSTYTFSCPSGSEDYGCAEYRNYFDKKQCIRKNCRKFELSCSENQTLSCKRYEILPNGSYGACISGVCIQNKTTFVPLPPMERPYKIKSYYNLQRSDSSEYSAGVMTYQPYCHRKAAHGASISYESTDLPAKQRFSSMLNNNVFVCEKDYELDDGFRIKEYIRHGIIPDNEDSILIFQTLLPASELSKSDHEKVLLLKEIPVPTAVATSDRYGNIIEYDFVDENNGLDGQQRAKYRIYIKSLFTYINKNSTYPKIKEYGATRNYSHLSFWDSLDCKIIQFISMQGYDGGFTEDINGAISGVQDGNDNKMLSSALNGMLQMLKFVFMSFPFGILVFILMFSIGVALFMLVARAAQQYCICVFHLVMLIYLSPFVFLLWLFDQTKNVMKTWISDIKTNILGACVPFVSISMFLFIIDWLFFGDVDKYISMQLFLPSGEINDNCYEGHLNDAPIACLTKRCLKTFTWLGLLGLNSGGSFYSAESFKMLGYLVLRCLFVASIIMSMTSLLDKLEKAIYDIIGGSPKIDIDVGFNGKASNVIKTGLNAGLGLGKFSLFSAKATAGVVSWAFDKVSGIFGGVYDVFSGSKIGTTKKRLMDRAGNVTGRVANGINYIPNMIGQGFSSLGNRIGDVGNSMARGANRLFGTQRWRDHQRRLNDIENNYNNSMAMQLGARNQKIQNINNAFEQQRSNNANIANEYANELARQNRFNQQQIEFLKEQKLAELTNEANRIRQNGIDAIDQEFNQKQNEILQERNNSRNNENNGW